jgi:hypothetical protein
MVVTFKPGGEFVIEITERSSGDVLSTSKGKVSAIDPSKTPGEIDYVFTDRRRPASRSRPSLSKARPAIAKGTTSTPRCWSGRHSLPSRRWTSSA